MLCVPCLALIIVGRQLYLSKRYGLSTWKGGGMGMFAAADELPNRYAKVFLIDADGNRNPLVQLSPDDFDLLNRALEYPIRENFLRAASLMAVENWIPSFQPRPVLNVDTNGQPVSESAKSYRVMVASQLRPDRKSKRPSIEIQFWKLVYDPRTRHVRALLSETFLFTSEDLFESSKEMKNS
jgi:hypothetical protein